MKFILKQAAAIVACTVSILIFQLGGDRVRNQLFEKVTVDDAVSPKLNATTTRIRGRPLHIYIMAGQSNMMGFGSRQHLELLFLEQQQQQQDASRPNKYAHLFDGQHWSARDHVYVCSPRRSGRLSMGYGFNSSFFGPELGFGWTVSEAMPGQDILLIKTAWNGNSLGVEFRPPSAGLGNYTNFKGNQRPSHRYGTSYRKMQEFVNSTMQNLTDIVLDYKDHAGFEFKGFVWFQGWSDLGVQFTNEYAYNLAHLIRDVRDFTQTPELLVIVGGVGQYRNGPSNRAQMERLRQQQESVTLLPEFRNSTRFVPTAAFFNESRKESYGVGYHYNGYADTIYNIGQAFGRSMLELLNRTTPSVTRRLHV
jgi:hypothetical protein